MFVSSLGVEIFLLKVMRMVVVLGHMDLRVLAGMIMPLRACHPIRLGRDIGVWRGISCLCRKSRGRRWWWYKRISWLGAGKGVWWRDEYPATMGSEHPSLYLPYSLRGRRIRLRRARSVLIWLLDIVVGLRVSLSHTATQARSCWVVVLAIQLNGRWSRSCRKRRWRRRI